MPSIKSNVTIISAFMERRRRILRSPVGAGIIAYCVGIDPIGALVTARALAREGDDTAELEAAAIAALIPRRNRS
jgi:hypothetical protein